MWTKCVRSIWTTPTPRRFAASTPATPTCETGSTSTPASLLEIIDRLAHLGLLDYEVASFHPTARDDLEFFVSLRALTPAELLPDSQRARQRQSIATARAALARAEVPAGEQRPSEPAGGDGGMQLSERERRLIGFKRAVMSRVRQAARRR